MHILLFISIFAIFTAINADFKKDITKFVEEINNAVKLEDHETIAGFIENSAIFYDCLANRQKEELVEFIEFGKIELGKILSISEDDNSTISLITTSDFLEDEEIEWILKKYERENGTGYKILRGDEKCHGF